MPASRVLKKQYYLNEELAEKSLGARLLLPGLWILADRDGRLEDRPKRIKAELFPYDSVSIEKLLEELDGSFILRYEAEGKRLIQILNWEKHAKVHPKEKSFQFPSPELNGNKNNDPEGSSREQGKGKGKGKGKEGGVGETNPQRKLTPVPAPKLVFPPGLDTERCRAAWERWLTHKREIKKSYKSVDSQNTMLKRWAVFGAERFIDAIDHSIGSGYTGIFEDPKRGKSRGESAHERNMEKLRQAELEAMQNG